MVPEGSHVKSVYLTESTGVLASKDLASKILLDCSTIDVGTSLAVRDAPPLNTQTQRSTTPPSPVARSEPQREP
jgi:hypothetical protein